MNSVPLIRRRFVRQRPAKRKLLQNASSCKTRFACDNRGVAALSFSYDFSQ
jgi:hypothetical protein